jgi:hypothetical protein
MDPFPLPPHPLPNPLMVEFLEGEGKPETKASPCIGLLKDLWKT